MRHLEQLAQQNYDAKEEQSLFGGYELDYGSEKNHSALKWIY